MPFKPYGRENYAVWRTLVGFGRIGPFSTCQTRLRLAEQMEDLWVSLPGLGFSDLVQAVLDGRTSVPDIWGAHCNGGLVALRQQLSPTREETVAEAVAEFKPYVTDDRVKKGLDEIAELAGDQPFAFLLEPAGVRNVLSRAMNRIMERTAPDGTRVVRRHADGTEFRRSANSVRRSVWRAINDLLVHRVGRSKRAVVLADIKAPGKRRLIDSDLTAEQIQTLISSCDEEFRPFVLFAVLTGIDRGPMLALKVKHYDEAEQTIYVPDTKTEARPRKLDLSDLSMANVVLRVACSGKGPEDKIFPFTTGQVTGRWRAARKRAGLEWFRLKDLRHVFATKWMQAGEDIRTLQGWLGHSTYYTTMEYVGTVKKTGAASAGKAAEKMGLSQPHLTLSGAM